MSNVPPIEVPKLDSNEWVVVPTQGGHLLRPAGPDDWTELERARKLQIRLLREGISSREQRLLDCLHGCTHGIRLRETDYTADSEVCAICGYHFGPTN